MGRECPRHARVLLLQGPAADEDGQRAGRQPRAVRHRPGAAAATASASLPEYQVAMIDEAHTLEAVAGEHMGVQLSSVGDRLLAGPAVQRAERQGRAGRPSRSRWPRRSSRRQRTREVAEDFFNRVAYMVPGRSLPASTAGCVNRPAGASRFCEELRRLAAAIDRGAATIDKPEEKIELTAAEERCRSLADQVASWIRQSAEDAVYWLEVEQKIPPSGPAGRGAAGRRPEPAQPAVHRASTPACSPRRRSASARRRDSTSSRPGSA